MRRWAWIIAMKALGTNREISAASFRIYSVLIRGSRQKAYEDHGALWDFYHDEKSGHLLGLTEVNALDWILWDARENRDIHLLADIILALLVNTTKPESIPVVYRLEWVNIFITLLEQETPSYVPTIGLQAVSASHTKLFASLLKRKPRRRLISAVITALSTQTRGSTHPDVHRIYWSRISLSLIRALRNYQDNSWEYSASVHANFLKILEEVNRDINQLASRWPGETEYAFRILDLVQRGGIYDENGATPMERAIPLQLLSELAQHAWTFVNFSCGDILTGHYDLVSHYPSRMRKQILPNLLVDFFSLLRSLCRWTVKALKSENHSAAIQCLTETLKSHVDQAINALENYVARQMEFVAGEHGNLVSSLAALDHDQDAEAQESLPLLHELNEMLFRYFSDDAGIDLGASLREAGGH